ncbi:MAG: hypothetical protein GY866_36220 [Proteobacteria bacterium]|nr:hypothetical protein [Pseudomonadota bacterium]
MLLRDLRARFKNTIPLSDSFFKLMQDTFSFYTELCAEFFSNLGNHVEENTFVHYLQNKIRPRLFDPEHCRKIEKVKKQFLAENIKLEQYIQENNFQEDFINDLSALKKVSDAIYELLQTHWEFFKYEKTVANNKAIIAFILEIDRVGIRWDSYLDKYLAISSVLKAEGGEIKKEGFTSLLVQYHLPEEVDFTIEMSTNLMQFLQLAYQFVVKAHDNSEDIPGLEISTLEVRHPVRCVLMVSDLYIESYKKFIGYLSVDIVKRETLLKFVMEVVRLQQGKEMAKQTVTNFQKKIAKNLNELHPEGYMSVDHDEAEDSVKILSALCNEMDRMKIEYKDMLTGATDRLARNRKQSLSDMTSSPIKTSDTSDAATSNSSATKENPATSAVKVPEPPSTVKIDVSKKEHIQLLTSPEKASEPDKPSKKA